jgi:hypothetical protein
MSLSFRVIGLIFLGFATVALIGSARFFSNALVSEGTVVGVRTEQSAAPLIPAEEGSGVTYYPIVEYVGPDGLIRQFEGRAGSQRQIYSVDETVSILVRDGNPESARINSFFNVWGRAIVTGGLGVIFLLVGFLSPLGFGGSERHGGR